MSQYPKARKKALIRSKKSSKKFGDKYEIGVGGMCLIPRIEEERLAPVFSEDMERHPTLASIATVLAFTDIAIDEGLSHYKRIRKNSTTKHFLGTFCYDEGIIDCDHFLDFDFDYYKSKVHKALTKVGLHAICFVQVDRLIKTPDYPKDRYLIHVHALCWRYDNSFQPVSAGARLSKPYGGKNNLGAKVVKFRTRKQAAGAWNERRSGRRPAYLRRLEVDQNAASIAHLMHYMLRQTAMAKVECPPTEVKEKSYLRSSESKLTPKRALEMADFLSTIHWRDAMFSAGDGKKIAAPIRKQFNRYIKRQSAMRSR